MWERIEQLMAAKGVKISDIHKATGISYSSFTDWRQGKCNPKPDKLQKIADYFDVPVGWLLNGTVQSNAQVGEYPITDDTKKLLRIFSERKDIQQFVLAAESADPEDVREATNVLLALKRKGK